jgi:hypothetical protein
MLRHEPEETVQARQSQQIFIARLIQKNVLMKKEVCGLSQLTLYSPRVKKDLIRPEGPPRPLHQQTERAYLIESDSQEKRGHSPPLYPNEA